MHFQIETLKIFHNPDTCKIMRNRKKHHLSIHEPCQKESDAFSFPRIAPRSLRSRAFIVCLLSSGGFEFFSRREFFSASIKVKSGRGNQPRDVQWPIYVTGWPLHVPVPFSDTCCNLHTHPSRRRSSFSDIWIARESVRVWSWVWLCKDGCDWSDGDLGRVSANRMACV